MDRNTRYRYWKTVAEAAGYRMEKQKRPPFVAGRETPETLNHLTIGQLIELSEVGDSDTSVYRIAEIIMGLTPAETDDARAVDVVRLVGWVFSEVETINKLFSKLESKPTARERQAGAERLDFGLFGMLDWYARRMGITNHDDVLTVPWMRIYKCMDMDKQTRDYEQRLQDIATNEINHKRR